MSSPSTTLNILFYDAECGFCTTALLWIAQRDRDHLFYYAPLTGSTATNMLDKKYQTMQSVIFYERGKISVRAEAVFRALRYLGGIWKILSYLPPFFGTPFYYLIAKWRRKIPFKKKMLPKERLLP